MRSIKGALTVLAVILVALLLFRPFVIVPAGHRAVVFSLSKGVLEKQLDEGFHFLMPVLHRPLIYDARTQTYSLSRIQWEGEVRGNDSMETLTKDGQKVSVDMSVRFRVDPDNVWRLHQNVGEGYVAKLIRPAAQGHTRIAIAKFPVTDVFSLKRQEIEDEMERQLRASLKENFLVVDEVLLRDIRFSATFQQSIVAKQIAQQEAQRMEYVLDKTEKEKQQKVLEASGEAEAIELKGKAIATNPQVVLYEYVQRIAPNVRTIISDGEDISLESLLKGSK